LKKSYPASTNFLVRLARQRDGGLGRSRHIIPRFRSASTSLSARRSASARPCCSPTKPIRTLRTRCTTAMP